MRLPPSWSQNTSSTTSKRAKKGLPRSWLMKNLGLLTPVKRAVEGLELKDVLGLRLIFGGGDENGDGDLDKGELARLLSRWRQFEDLDMSKEEDKAEAESQADSLIRKYDDNSDGGI